MPNNLNPDKEKFVVLTPEQTLKQAVADTKKLDKESQEALEQEDEQKVVNKLKQRARIVAELPEKIMQAGISTGQNISADEMEILYSLQYIAQEALEREKAYELGMILTDTQGGSKLGEPNLLEQLVNRVYPQKPE